ncbi:class I glutamine amidotransferase-like protein [Mrakia frigida]|uniref:type 1 glutamine amidotransferase domain-containing protein n=1 Tax=Mrakia frigida TaxID=29902 RepID=UPI003FCC1DE4
MSAQHHKKSILIVLTSCDKLITGGQTGWYLPELAHSYYIFKDSFKLTLASPKGGKSPLDEGSAKAFAEDADSAKFLKDTEALALVDNTVKLSSVSEKDFDAVFYVGGHGPVIDLPVDQNSIRLIQEFYNAGKITAAVCHAPAVFKNVKVDNGDFLIKGKHFTGFSNSEEVAVGRVDDIPFLLQDVLSEEGGLYDRADDWEAHIVVDGNLYTGQNPASARPLAERLHMDLLVRW